MSNLTKGVIPSETKQEWPKVVEAKLHTPIHSGAIGEIPASLTMLASSPKKITEMLLKDTHLSVTFLVNGKSSQIGIPLANIKCFVLG